MIPVRLFIQLVLWYGVLGGLLGACCALYLRYVRSTPAPRTSTARTFGLAIALLAFSSPLFIRGIVSLLLLWALGYTLLIGLVAMSFWRLQRGRIIHDLRVFLAPPRFTTETDEEIESPDDPDNK